MNNKNIIIFVLSLGLLVTLFFSWKTTNICEQVNNNNIKLISELDSHKYSEKRDVEKYSENLFSENQTIPNISLFGADGDYTQLSDLVEKDTKLVYRFYETTCVQCVEDELDILKKIGDIIGFKKIIVISDYEKINRLTVMMKRKGIKSSFFIYKEKIPLPFEFDKKNVATFFLLDENLRTHFVYKTGGNQNINDPYYRRVLQFYKEGK